MSITVLLTLYTFLGHIQHIETIAFIKKDCRAQGQCRATFWKGEWWGVLGPGKDYFIPLTHITALPETRTHRLVTSPSHT